LIQPARLYGVDNERYLALPGGIIQGAYYTIARMITGAYEVATFPLPLPRKYQPLLWPETPNDGMSSVIDGRWPYPRWGFGRYTPAEYPKENQYDTKFMTFLDIF